jgi:hypothetical protein
MAYQRELTGWHPMGTKWEKMKAEYERVARVTVIGCVLAGLITYAVLITAKAVWGPEDFTWLRVAFQPLIVFGLIVGCMHYSYRRQLGQARREDELG